MTPERAQAIARDVLAELTGARRGLTADSEGAAEAVLNERFPDLAEYDRTAVLFRINRMLSARATRAARARAGHEGIAAAREEPQGDSAVAEAITARREELGLSLDELAVSVGVAPARMRNFELAHRRVPVAILARIAQVLQVDLAWFSGERPVAPLAPAPAAVPESATVEAAPAAAAVAPAAAPARGDDPDRDELYGLFTSLAPGMRRHVVGIMREMIAECERVAAGDEPGRRSA
ncbi:Helix-turn-helix domain-containing protein [Caenispirillum bisanense]|uniref:Helix-turn-helix domain-containing protein n=2 Tax=Caenispirillum bisanense TaxID=414052 RepID=A0A286GQH9_9PROT|nr:Helix-turn-helix domain-containing protein [Caenispirillum bisanense]